MSTSETRAASGTFGNVSKSTLLLSVLLAAATTAAVVLAVMRVSRPDAREGLAPGWERGAAGSGGYAAPLGSAQITPYVQRDTVQPLGQTVGTVYFPVPYGSTPSLKLTPADRYLITVQSEEGFSWIDRDRANVNELWLHFKDQADKIAKPGAPVSNDPDAKPATLPVQPELVWEAKGVVGEPGKRPRKPLEQTGDFATVFGTDGEIYFAEPFAFPPNVTLSGTYTESTVVTKVEPTHFKWKNGGTNQTWGQGSIRWTAKGLKGPPESAAK